MSLIRAVTLKIKWEYYLTNIIDFIIWSELSSWTYWMSTLRTFLLYFSIVCLNAIMTIFMQARPDIIRLLEDIKADWTKKDLLDLMKQIQIYVVILVTVILFTLLQESRLASHLVVVQLYNILFSLKYEDICNLLFWICSFHWIPFLLSINQLLLLHPLCIYLEIVRINPKLSPLLLRYYFYSFILFT